MRIKQLYIFLFFIWFGSTIIASTTDKADSWTKEKESIVHEVISTFHNSLGFDYLTREECDSLNADGLLSQLDESQRYYTYFELERILIKSSLFPFLICLHTSYLEIPIISVEIKKISHTPLMLS